MPPLLDHFPPSPHPSGRSKGVLGPGNFFPWPLFFFFFFFLIPRAPPRHVRSSVLFFLIPFLPYSRERLIPGFPQQPLLPVFTPPCQSVRRTCAHTFFFLSPSQRRGPSFFISLFFFFFFFRPTSQSARGPTPNVLPLFFFTPPQQHNGSHEQTFFFFFFPFFSPPPPPPPLIKLPFRFCLTQLPLLSPFCQVWKAFQGPGELFGPPSLFFSTFGDLSDCPPSFLLRGPVSKQAVFLFFFSSCSPS